MTWRSARSIRLVPRLNNRRTGSAAGNRSHLCGPFPFQPGLSRKRVVVAIARDLGLPIQYVGVGETLDDLLPFSPLDFVESLF